MHLNARTIATAALTAATFLAACEAQPKHVASADEVTAELAFPTGDRSTSAVLVRQISPREPRAGREYAYVVDVTNLTDGTLRNVKINMEEMANVQFLGSTPEPAGGTNGGIAWVISDLAPHATKSISIRARPMAAGTTSQCLSASYANTLCTASSAVSPGLALAKAATPEVCGACEDIKLTYTVRNPGTGTVDAVTVRDTLPEGLRTADGKQTVSLDAGDIPPGAEKTFTVNARATKGGSFTSTASATSESGLTAKSAEVTTTVNQPALAFSCDANNRVVLGHDLPYRITVTNTGKCEAANAAIQAIVPEGCRFVSSEGNGALEGGRVTWNLERLAPGRSATVTMNLRPSGVGTATVAASAWADCVAPRTTECTTEVVGIPAVLLEVIDTVDPVHVGTETSFNVVVTNQGTSPDSNVTVAGTLPPSMEFVSATGTTHVTCNGQMVTLQPVEKLEPGAKAEWRITVKAKSPADSRSRWEMTSDRFRTPVVETESTTLYQ